MYQNEILICCDLPTSRGEDKPPLAPRALASPKFVQDFFLFFFFSNLGCFQQKLYFLLYFFILSSPPPLFWSIQVNTLVCGFLFSSF